MHFIVGLFGSGGGCLFVGVKSFDVEGEAA